ncbi:MAG: T9SS type A sorting domain-containing protein [Sphingobacteriales bacterium]|nr:MAG: T9SS type A sorting domain-containing protein [Sphingobacteriales bacterium]
MKKILLFVLLAAGVTFFQSSGLFAQCGDRYLLPIFSNVTVVNNVQYGSNVTVEGTTKILQFDFYEPQGDDFEMRPLIILAHGGTFVAGDENSPDIVYLCQELAKRGYACASINYRLLPYATAIASLFNGQIQSVFFDEVAKAVTDMRAAIRYFRQDAATTNAYRIDPNQIFIGGASAGAITAVHAAYLTSETDFDGYTLTGGLTPMDHINNNGGFEGNSGNPGYSSSVIGLINLCGAIGSINFMQAGETPVVSLHGTTDSVVPYGTGSANAFGVPVITVDGSQVMHQRADLLNIPNALLSFPGEDHMAHDSQTNRPASLAFITEFLYDLVDCSSQSVGIEQNTTQQLQPDIVLYPNPASSNTEVTLSFSNFDAPNVTVQLFSLLGQKVLEFTAPSNTFVSLNLSKLSAGMYQVMVSDGVKMSVKKLSIVK